MVASVEEVSSSLVREYLSRKVSLASVSCSVLTANAAS